jgi:hypothetical protein
MKSLIIHGAIELKKTPRPLIYLTNITVLVGFPGKGTGYPALPPQIRTSGTPASGSSVLILLTKPETNRAIPQLAHSYATLKALHRSCGDTVCGPGVPPVVPSDGSLCPASPSLQWVAWVSLPHLTGQKTTYFRPSVI